LLLDDALTLKPKLVIAAPYFGNDFYEAFLMFRRHNPEFAAWVSPQLAAQALELENSQTIFSDVSGLYNNLVQAENAPEAGSARRWLSDNVKLYALLRAVKYRLQPRPAVTPLLSRNLDTAAQALTPDKARFASVLDGQGWRTILTAPYRNRVIDDSDPRIRVGFEVSREAVRQMAKRCKAAGVEFLVVLIPTKEAVFFPRVADPAAHAGLQQVVGNETRLKEEWIADLEARDIKYVDAWKPLKDASTQPYPEDIDGHPTAGGHRVIAEEVVRNLPNMNPN
jgi:hypothetical protein